MFNVNDKGFFPVEKQSLDTVIILENTDSN